MAHFLGLEEAEKRKEFFFLKNTALFKPFQTEPHKLFSLFSACIHNQVYNIFLQETLLFLSAEVNGSGLLTYV